MLCRSGATKWRYTFFSLGIEPGDMTADDQPERPTVDGRSRAHVFVSGTVQGVYFRANTRDTAAQKDVDGWVRNLDDGRVEAVFEGPVDAVEEMVEWCHSGSPDARVEDVTAEYEEPSGLDGFSIRR